MIEEKTGNILTLTEGILVHGCNCQGVMGSGMALGIKNTYPAAYHVYKHQHANKGLNLGEVVFLKSSWYKNELTEVQKRLRPKTALIDVAGSDQLPENLVIANAMTQKYYGRDKNVVYVDYNAVYEAFRKIGEVAKETGLAINFPLIGCGLANGNWSDVSNMINSAAGPDVKLILWKQ